MQQIQHTKKRSKAKPSIAKLPHKLDWIMESDPLKFWLADVFYAIGVELEGARFHGPKQSDNLPPTTVSSFADEDAFELEDVFALEDAFNEEVMLHKFLHIMKENTRNTQKQNLIAPWEPLALLWPSAPSASVADRPAE